MVSTKKTTRTKPKPKRQTPGAILYARFSPRRNESACESIETQLEACRAYCTARGLLILGEFIDRAMSGDDIDRPGLWEAVDELRPGDVLLVHKLDRLARDMYLAEMLHREVGKRRATIEAVEGGGNGVSPEHQMLRQMLQAFAEYERKVISARTKAAMLRHQSTGRAMSSRLPYGWDADPERPGMMVPNEDERKVLSTIKIMRGKGFGFDLIAKRLNEAGVPAKYGARWYAMTISQIERRGGFDLV